MPSFANLKAWQHARRLAVECARACFRLPRDERGVLGRRLRHRAYAMVSGIAAGAVAHGAARRRVLDRARRSLAAVEALIHVGHDLGCFSIRDYARLEAWCVETGKTLDGLRRKSAGGPSGS